MTIDSRQSEEEIAVFGGSFDPPHVSHVLAVTTVLCLTSVSRVLVVPTFEHPFGKSLAPYAHRLAMCELAFSDLRRVELCDVERRLGGLSYTVRMLEALRRDYPQARLRFVVGADVLEQRDRWKDFDRIERLAPLIVLGRDGFEASGNLGVALPGVSSTTTRERLRSGQDVSELIPQTVSQYIATHDLYRSEAP